MKFGIKNCWYCKAGQEGNTIRIRLPINYSSSSTSIIERQYLNSAGNFQSSTVVAGLISILLPW